MDKFYLKNASLLHSSGKVDGRSYRSFLLTRSFMVVVFAFQPPHRVLMYPIYPKSALIPIYNPVFSWGFTFASAAKKPTNNTNKPADFCFRYRASDVYQTCFSSWRSCQKRNGFERTKHLKTPFRRKKCLRLFQAFTFFNELEDVGGFGLGFVMIRELC